MVASTHPTWLERDHRFIPAHQQPALLMDFAMQNGIDSNRLLSHTGVFYQDIISGNVMMSQEQFQRLISNSQKLLKQDDLSFLFGHRLFPGNYGAVTEAILQADSLLSVFEVICDNHLVTSPLLKVNLRIDEQYGYLDLIDYQQRNPNHQFLVEAYAAGLQQISRWLTGSKLPWRFCFSHSQPKYIEQYEVHLAGDCLFDHQTDTLILPIEALQHSFNKGRQTAFAVARQKAEESYAQLPSCFITAVYEYLYQEINRSPSLLLTAEHFAMSPATFKRKLKSHQCSFQQLQDIVRKQVAVYLFTYCGFTNEQVANHLNFADVNNFRRSFKRWTGLSPSVFKQI